MDKLIETLQYVLDFVVGVGLDQLLPALLVAGALLFSTNIGTEIVKVISRAPGRKWDKVKWMGIQKTGSIIVAILWAVFFSEIAPNILDSVELVSFDPEFSSYLNIFLAVVGAGKLHKAGLSIQLPEDKPEAE